jgi:hypothetical protein
MPLRDHFHPPLDDRTSWEGLHGGWPAMIVQRLNPILPRRYVAGPRVHLGTEVEIDRVTFEEDEADIPVLVGGNSTTCQPGAPSLAVETDLASSDEYEVLVYDTECGRRLVAAVEIVSPSNKDRPGPRVAFIGKCLELLRKGISVTIIDLDTSWDSNLYAGFLELIGQVDPSLGSRPPATYAAACRWIERGRKRMLETWSHTLTLGQPLPTLPLWLAENFAVPLDLEASYEETCQVLRIV